MKLMFKVSAPKKHSVQFKANDAYQDGEQVVQDIWERFIVYVPNNVLSAIGWKTGEPIEVEIKVP